MKTIKLIYRNVDITDSVDILRCRHEMNAESMADSVELIVDDSNNLWDKWNPQQGDELSLLAANVKTGKLYLHDVRQDNGRFALYAASIPVGAKTTRSKAWQSARLLQMGEEIAKNHGLGFKHYGVDDVRLPYYLQYNEHDFSFLSRIGALEGCAFLIYDGNLVLYGENAVESTDPADTLELAEDSSFRLFDRSGDLYGSCAFTRGNYRGAFQCKNGKESAYVPGVGVKFSISSNAEANRYAKNLLRGQNKNAYTGYVRYDEIIRKNVPGAVFHLKCERLPSWNGTIFVTKVRNDYVSGKSKMFFRRTLEGEY